MSEESTATSGANADRGTSRTSPVLVLAYVLSMTMALLSIGWGGLALVMNGGRDEWVALSDVVLPAPPIETDEQALALETKLAVQAPKGIHIVIDRIHNRLFLKDGKQTVVTATCSTGSGTVLADEVTGNEWTFDTPAGAFKIRKKVENPIWIKPDWAFIEEGDRPPRNRKERYEPGVLGEFSMHLGDGYMIHGTLYERMLGRSVSHGCIRLGKKDLRVVYDTVSVGTPVYIF